MNNKMILTAVLLSCLAAPPAQAVDDLDECKGARCQSSERYNAAMERARAKPGMQALTSAAAAQPDLNAPLEVLKRGSDAQMAPVTGAPKKQPAAFELPAPEEPESAYYGGTIKRDAEIGQQKGIQFVRAIGSGMKLPFAAIGGVAGGIYGTLRAIFAKDDDDHNNNVGAGFMLGASMAGHFVGKGIQWLLKVPALVAGAVGMLIGGVVGLFHGLFKK